jgi:hypothetical protein
MVSLFPLEFYLRGNIIHEIGDTMYPIDVLGVMEMR